MAEKKSTLIYFLRHCEPNVRDRIADPKLSLKGRNRAIGLGKLIQNISGRIDQIITTSNTNRVEETAELINKEIGFNNIKLEYLSNLKNEEFEGKTSVIIAHSNTIHEFIRFFNDGNVPNFIPTIMKEDDYSHFYLLTYHSKDEKQITELYYSPSITFQSIDESILKNLNWIDSNHQNKIRNEFAAAAAADDDDKKEIIFKINPQPLYADSNIQTITIAIRGHKIKDGPEDDDIKVVNVTNDFILYDYDQYPRIEKIDEKYIKEGVKEEDFATVKEGTYQFTACMSYVVVRKVLDIFKAYNDNNKIEFHFIDKSKKQLLLFPYIDRYREGRKIYDFENAFSDQHGFLACGYSIISSNNNDDDHEKKKILFGENFDVIAHEIGHTMLYTLGNDESVDFHAFHETMGDIVAFITTLHFEEVVILALRKSFGNLGTKTILSRVGELSNSSEIRNLLNNISLNSRITEPHDRSQPMSSSLFDIFLRIYFILLSSRHVIPESLANNAFKSRFSTPTLSLKSQFKDAFTQNGIQPYISCVIDARNYLGKYFIASINQLSALHDRNDSNFTFKLFAEKFLSIEKLNNNSLFYNDIYAIFKNHNIL